MFTLVGVLSLLMGLLAELVIPHLLRVAEQAPYLVARS